MPANKRVVTFICLHAVRPCCFLRVQAGLQPTLVAMVAELGKPTVVVLGSSSAVGMDAIKAQPTWSVLLPGLNGIFGADAVASVLFGDVAPAGLLPYTIYHESWAAAGCGSGGKGCTNTFADMDLRSGDGRTYKWYGYSNATLKPAYEFGTGHYYSNFSIHVKAASGSGTGLGSGLGLGPVSVNKHTAGEALATYTATYTNTGSTLSRCRVLLFAVPVSISDTNAPSPHPVKQLFNFGGSPVLAPGATFTEGFTVKAGDLAMTDSAGKSAAYKGWYEIRFAMGNGVYATEQLAVTSTTVLGQLPPPRAP